MKNWVPRCRLGSGLSTGDIPCDQEKFAMKKKPAKKPPTVHRAKRACYVCDGMGQMCDNCGESETACHCDEGESQLVPHDSCFGTGIAPRDIVESDLELKDVPRWRKERKEEGLD